MEITWYGLSCFRLVERGAATIVTDPYDHDVLGYGALKLRADIVTVSHDAPGHNFVDGVKRYEHLLDGPGEYEIGSVFITGVRTNGTQKDSDESRNTLYVFDFDGLTVAHLGDLRTVPSRSQIDALGEVNIVLVPVGSGGGLNAAKAAEVVSILEPNIVIPMHYATPGLKVALEPLDKFIKEMGLGSIETKDSLKLTKRDLPEETRVVVLDSQS